MGFHSCYGASHHHHEVAGRSFALASLALAEPEADPAYLYRGYYGYPHAYRPYGYGYGYYNGFYGRSAYGYGLPNGYTHVDRLHKREADAQYSIGCLYGCGSDLGPLYLLS